MTTPRELLLGARERLAKNIEDGTLVNRDNCISWLMGYLSILGYIPIELIDYCDELLAKRRN